MGDLSKMSLDEIKGLIIESMILGESGKLALALDELAKRLPVDAGFYKLFAKMVRGEQTVGGLIIEFKKHPSYADVRSTVSHAAKRYQRAMKIGELLDSLGYSDPTKNKNSIRGKAITKLRQEGITVSDSTLKSEYNSYQSLLRQAD